MEKKIITDYFSKTTKPIPYYSVLQDLNKEIEDLSQLKIVLHELLGEKVLYRRKNYWMLWRSQQEIKQIMLQRDNVPIVPETYNISGEHLKGNTFGLSTEKVVTAKNNSVWFKDKTIVKENKEKVQSSSTKLAVETRSGSTTPTFVGKEEIQSSSTKLAVESRGGSTTPTLKKIAKEEKKETPSNPSVQNDNTLNQNNPDPNDDEYGDDINNIKNDESESLQNNDIINNQQIVYVLPTCNIVIIDTSTHAEALNYPFNKNTNIWIWVFTSNSTLSYIQDNNNPNIKIHLCPSNIKNFNYNILMAIYLHIFYNSHYNYNISIWSKQPSIDEMIIVLKSLFPYISCKFEVWNEMQKIKEF